MRKRGKTNRHSNNRRRWPRITRKEASNTLELERLARVHRKMQFPATDGRKFGRSGDGERSTAEGNRFLAVLKHGYIKKKL